MAYGDYSGSDKPNKGHEGGACNRQRCQAEPAIWWNHGSSSWYCADCRRDIQFDSFNLRDWEQNWQPRKGHPMFETREEMDARKAALASFDEDHSRIYGAEYGDRSVKRSHRAEGRNYVD